MSSKKCLALSGDRLRTPWPALISLLPTCPSHNFAHSKVSESMTNVMILWSFITRTLSASLNHLARKATYENHTNLSPQLVWIRFRFSCNSPPPDLCDMFEICINYRETLSQAACSFSLAMRDHVVIVLNLGQPLLARGLALPP
jgi:hypothetical protein